MSRNKQSIILYSISLVCLVTFGLTLYLGYYFYQEIADRDSMVEDLARKDADKIAHKVDHELAQLQALAQRVATDLGTGALAYDRVVERLENELTEHDDIFGIGVAFERGVYVPDGLFAPFLSKDKNGQFNLSGLEDIYDYTDPVLSSSGWYREALAAEGIWRGPSFDKASQAWLIGYYAPYYQETPNGRNPAGVVYIVHSLDTFGNFIKSIDTGEKGFLYLLSADGTYIAHPSQEFLLQTIFDKATELKADKATESNGERLEQIGERAITGKNFRLRGEDPITERPTWTIHYLIARANWSVGIVFDQTIGQERPYIFVRTFTWLMLCTILFLVSLVALLLRVHHNKPERLWAFSIMTALFFLTGIVLFWYLAIDFTPRDPGQQVLANEATVEKQLARVNSIFEKDGLTPPRPIKTGLILETIGFANSNENMVTGYLWQKYPLDLPPEIERGFLFTDAVDPLGGTVQELYRLEEAGHELIVWFFRATLRQEPSVEKFPLDEATVQLQIWPKSLSPDIILVPDLDSYDFVIPSKSPGVVSAMVLENWSIDRSYFSYRFDKYNANLGSSLIRKRSVPDLYFNVIIRRAIVSPLVAQALTMLIIGILAFAVLVVNVSGSFEVLGYGASLFFVVVISHIGLRDELEIPGVVYLEYGYIILYLMILLISLNSILHNSNVKLSFIQYKNNLWPKVLYWPLFSGIFLAVTILFLLPPPLEADEMAPVAAGVHLDGPIKIGLIAPLTGSPTSSGENTLRSAQFAVDIANEAGGLEVDGVRREVQLFIEDDESNPLAAVAAARNLIAQHNVIAIIGPQSSSQAVPAGSLINERETIMISPKSTNPNTTLDRPWVYRVPFLDPFQGEVMADVALNSLAATNAAILFTIDNNYSKGLALNFRDSFESAGGTIAAYESFHKGDTDLRLQLEEIKKKSPDVLFLPTSFTEVPTIIKQLDELDMQPQILGGDSWSKRELLDPELLALCGTVCDDLLFSALYVPDLATDVSRNFAEEYSDRYGLAPDDTVALTYDAFQLLFNSIQQAGTLEKVAIREALDTIEDFEGATGAMHFDANGDPTKCAVIVKIIDGEFAYHDQFCPPDFP